MHDPATANSRSMLLYLPAAAAAFDHVATSSHWSLLHALDHIGKAMLYGGGLGGIGGAIIVVLAQPREPGPGRIVTFLTAFGGVTGLFLGLVDALHHL
jgi:hypothetical protein